MPDEISKEDTDRKPPPDFLIDSDHHAASVAAHGDTKSVVTQNGAPPPSQRIEASLAKGPCREQLLGELDSGVREKARGVLRIPDEVEAVRGAGHAHIDEMPVVEIAIVVFRV